MANTFELPQRLPHNHHFRSEQPSELYRDDFKESLPIVGKEKYSPIFLAKVVLPVQENPEMIINVVMADNYLP